MHDRARAGRFDRPDGTRLGGGCAVNRQPYLPRHVALVFRGVGEQRRRTSGVTQRRTLRSESHSDTLPAVARQNRPDKRRIFPSTDRAIPF